MTAIAWYFDPISPFAWLAWNRLGSLGLQPQLQPRPILFAGLLDHYRTLGPAEIPAKRRFTYRSVQWRAEQQQLPFKFPPAHPFNPLSSLRLCIAAGADSKAVGCLLAFVWGQGRDPSQVDELTALAQALGIDDAPAALASPAVKQQLKENFQAALNDQVFGVPTAVFDGQLYWGDDSVEMLQQALREPDRFRQPPYSEIDQIPIGIARSPRQS